MVDMDLRAQALETVEMEVHRSSSDVAATGNRDAGETEASEQGAEHAERGAHLADQLVGRFQMGDVGGIYDDGRIVDEFGDCAEPIEKLDHGACIFDSGNIAKRYAAFYENGSGHDGKGGILAAAHAHF